MNPMRLSGVPKVGGAFILGDSNFPLMRPAQIDDAGEWVNLKAVRIGFPDKAVRIVGLLDQHRVTQRLALARVT